MKNCMMMLVAACAAGTAFGWGWGPHNGHATITRAAAMSLAEPDRAMFGKELDELMVHYSLIPDWVYRKDGTEHYVWDYVGSTSMSTPEFMNFHLISASPTDYEILVYLVKNAVAAAKEGRTHDFACYSGTLAHLLGDWTDPAHSGANDVMMGMFETYFPLPEGAPVRDSGIHSALEPDVFCIDDHRVTAYVIAESPEELAFRLMARAYATSLVSRTKIYPLYRLMLKGDTEAMKPILADCGRAAVPILADALKTMCALGRGAAKRENAGGVPLADYWPKGTASFAYPHAMHFGTPYWGHMEKDFCYGKGAKREPLKLVIDGKVQATKGLFMGNGKLHAFFIPAGVFGRFTARVGLQTELAKGGACAFIVSANGKELACVEHKAGEEAGTIDVALPPEASEITLRVASRPKLGDPAKCYGIFAEPTLWPRAGGPVEVSRIRRLLADRAAGIEIDPKAISGFNFNRWTKRLRQKQDEIAATKGEVDLVFVGDSITHFWEVNDILKTNGQKQLDLLRKTYSILDLGYSGDVYENVLWRMTNGELDGYRAKAIMLMIGTNDFARFPLSAEDGAKKLAAILKVIRAKQPQAKVIMLPIFPAFANPRVGKRADCNALAKKLADGKDVIWCDFNEKFLDAKGEVRTDLMPDRLHPNDAGYVIWREAVTPLFRQVCGK